ncbi:hypothetical protein EG68_02243 [Paragonimus skrjabini miyazakii]|uniref:HMG box domain-containing protein n=1 Tax=Paragonimus skrjabini miyazakii TaxID=59628 RepID=A0A8S9YZH8_9TREM|nr:hypothetical protein EG68_02243 [Paragonimus skrjabini miyazakii]
MWMHDCTACASAKTNGLQTWMRHLTEQHVLPTEWPSERAAKLTGVLALRPYTTITESKKKRRKDSVPRPLNSFMLFAQHIRRNVLRVFSDASNSAISQQLGDLWRTVPHQYRNQYDDEANRLVKIHQLEFPNYKYQPKKRQPLTHHHTNSSNTDGETSRLVATIRQQSREPEYSTRLIDRTSTKQSPSECGVPNNMLISQGSTVLKHKLSSASTLPSFRSTCVQHVEQPSKTLSSSGCQQGSKLNETLFRIVTPNKQTATSSTYVNARIETRSLNVGTSTIYRTNANSLSSVLPPLLTPSSKSVATVNADLFYHQGSCDSAYASGINSSSSSSASSPAVGDLLSPTKPGMHSGSCSKSPVRRRIQFVPIRPQSQQQQSIQLLGTQPTRQRFLSANDGSSHQVQPTGFLLNESPNFSHMIVVEAPSGDVNDHTSSDVIYNSDLETPKIHQLLAPIYVRLASETGECNEDVLLALPAGTTIIHTTGDVNRIPLQNSQLKQQSRLPNRRVLLNHQAQAARGRSVQMVHALKLINVGGRPVGSCTAVPTVSAGEDLSPPPYSSGSSTSSAWSPLSGDVFLPLQHMSGTIMGNELGCASEPHLHSCYSVVSNLDSGLSPHDSQNETRDLGDIDINSQFEMDIEQPLPDFHYETKLVYANTYDVCADNHEPPNTWSMPEVNREQPSEETTVHSNSNRLLTTNSPLPLAPLAVDTLKQSPTTNLSEGILETATPTSVFTMANDEDTFDSSFDAMMNSIDITSFLPGTFPENDEVDLVATDYPPKNCTSKQAFKCYSPEKVVTTITSVNRLHERFGDTNEPSEAKYTTFINDMGGQTVIMQGDCTTVPCLMDPMPSYSNYAEDDTLFDLQMVDMQHLIDTNSNTVCLPKLHSSLSDLDSLDKSSLFSLKPDWSLRVCE